MADNLAFKDDIWEELINGEIIQMSPSLITNHNRVIEFKCSLYDDLIISLNNVFDRVN